MRCTCRAHPRFGRAVGRRPAPSRWPGLWALRCNPLLPSRGPVLVAPRPPCDASLYPLATRPHRKGMGQPGICSGPCASEDHNLPARLCSLGAAPPHKLSPLLSPGYFMSRRLSGYRNLSPSLARTVAMITSTNQKTARAMRRGMPMSTRLSRPAAIA